MFKRLLFILSFVVATPVLADGPPLAGDEVIKTIGSPRNTLIVNDISSFVLSKTPRQYLTATKTYWVVGGGTNTPNCITFSTGCATVQYVVDLVQNTLDTAGQLVVINLTGGATFSGAITANGAGPGTSAIELIGSGSNATITTTSGNTLTVKNGATVFLSRITVTNSGAGNYGVTAQSGGNITVLTSDVNFGSTVASQIDASFFGQFHGEAGYTISGSAASHIHSNSEGFVSIDGATITCTGSPAFPTYFIGVGSSYVEAIGTTFSGCGTVTGPKFTTNRFGNIRINTDDLNYFPGSTAGTISQGSSYDNRTVQARTISSGTADTANQADSLLIWGFSLTGPSTESLPACTSTTPVQPFTIKDGGGGFGATNKLTITAPSSTIDGAASYIINTAWGFVTLKCDGVSNYLSIAH